VHGAKIQDSGVGIGRNHRKYNFVNTGMMEQKPYIITIVGPESSGKTTLARQLATELGCLWLPEYAREYLQVLGRDYNEADLFLIAEGQWAVIGEQLSVFGNQSSVGSKQSTGFPPGPLMGVNGLNEVITVGNQQSSMGNQHGILAHKDIISFQLEDFGDEPRPIVIIDSGMMGIRMWAKIKYNMSIPMVEQALQKDITSMYILCRPLLSWEADPLREAPLLLDRVWIYNHFLKELFLSQVR
jgi:nicotinamide riboside kinase